MTFFHGLMGVFDSLRGLGERSPGMRKALFRASAKLPAFRQSFALTRARSAA
jgi:hypothetical protein